MSINSIITPMSFSLARDAICQLLATERDKQIELAKEGGATEGWIHQTMDFTVFPKRFRYPDVSEMPCVYVYFNRGSFPEDRQDLYENEFVGNMQVEYYACGLNEDLTDKTEDEALKLINEAEANAEDRLNYLTAQIYKILFSEPTNLYRATDNIVHSVKLKDWERILTPRDTLGAAEGVLAARFSFELGINEKTYYTNTLNIKEFYTKLQIREEFIDPLIRRIWETL